MRGRVDEQAAHGLVRPKTGGTRMAKTGKTSLCADAPARVSAQPPSRTRVPERQQPAMLHYVMASSEWVACACVRA